jgi:AAA domain (dynein-related subfamily)
LASIDLSAVDRYCDVFIKQFPGFKSFEDPSYRIKERNYKVELSEAFRFEIVQSLENIPQGEQERVILGQAIVDLFTRKLTDERLPQNLVNWRDTVFAKKMDGAGLATLAAAVGQLVDEQGVLQDRIASFVRFISETSAALAEQSTPGQRRTLTSFFLSLSDPSRYLFIKTRALNRFLKTIAGKTLPSGELTGQSYKDLLEVCQEVQDHLRTKGWAPKDFIDLQSFIWVVESYDDVEDLEPEDQELFVDQHPKNLILYGPPGTGKTHQTTRIAVEICDGRAPSDQAELLTRYKALVDDRRICFVTFHESYGYEDFVEGYRPEVRGAADDALASGDMVFLVKQGVFKEIAQKARTESLNPNSALRNYVLIIDEINRGNISKIFGELITLIEPTRRLGQQDELTSTLPASGDQFGVPSNLYLVGTMNTADRSIALLDTALRRRFQFVELMPDIKVLKHPSIDGEDGSPIDLAQLLTTINRRIQFLQGRDHQIGHAYFLGISSLADLRRVVLNQVIPLLQEYFHEDLRLVQRVLGHGLIRSEVLRADGLFSQFDDPELSMGDDKFVYLVNPEPSGADFRAAYMGSPPIS